MNIYTENGELNLGYFDAQRLPISNTAVTTVYRAIPLSVHCTKKQKKKRKTNKKKKIFLNNK